jgi:hypothetical protein
MSTPSRWTRYCLVLAVVFAGVTLTAAQMRYWSGQNVAPVFEGWERNPDGTFNMVVGYYNRNLEEALDIPIGPDNNIEPGGPDQGQPTFFAPSRQKYVFRVNVPKDWGPTKRLVWTLTAHGKTEKANLFLLPEWETSYGVMLQNRSTPGGGAGGAGGGSGEYAGAPIITVGPNQTITLPNSVTITALVTGGPKPSPAGPQGARAGARVRAPQLTVDWIKYRGPVGGRVTFTPKSSPIVDGKALTTASFSVPGAYTLRGFATDGAVSTPADVTVTVNTGSSAAVVR